MNNERKNRADEILTSIDEIQPAETPPYFYTRLIGRMQTKEETRSFLLLRPAFLTAGLTVALAINIIFLLKPAVGESQLNKPATIQSFTEAYNLGSEPVYE